MLNLWVGVVLAPAKPAPLSHRAAHQAAPHPATSRAQRASGSSGPIARHVHHLSRALPKTIIAADRITDGVPLLPETRVARQKTVAGAPVDAMGDQTSTR